MAELGENEGDTPEFKGLNIASELGEIRYPEGAQIAQLSGESFTHRSFFDIVQEKPASTHVDTKDLQGILIKTQNAILFRGVDDRLIVLTKVGRIHLPFYRSAFGTSGKTRGAWYPFFGFSMQWLIKGSNEEAETGYANAQIKDVQDRLNRSLVLPTIPLFLKDDGMLRLANNGHDDFFDLNTLLPFKAIGNSPEYVEENEALRKITGYSPAPEIGPNYLTGNDLSFEWREGILSQI